MNQEIKAAYDHLMTTLTVRQMDDLYTSYMSDLEETEYLHDSILGLTDQQREGYAYDKENTTIYTIVEQMAEDQVLEQHLG